MEDETMPIPDFQTLMLPVLKYANAHTEHSLGEVVEFLASEFSLSEDERSVRIASGNQPVFYNRVAWARTYLKQAGLLETTARRKYLRITNRGKEVLKSNPTRVD